MIPPTLAEASPSRERLGPVLRKTTITNPNETTPATPAAEPTILIGDMKWSQVLLILIAALEDGTPTGVRLAKDQIEDAAIEEVA